MKIWAIRRTDTNQYLARNCRWSSKSANIFTRLSDLNYRLNCPLSNSHFYGVEINNVAILEYDLDAMTKKETLLSGRLFGSWRFSND